MSMNFIRKLAGFDQKISDENREFKKSSSLDEVLTSRLSSIENELSKSKIKEIEELKFVENEAHNRDKATGEISVFETYLKYAFFFLKSLIEEWQEEKTPSESNQDLIGVVDMKSLNAIIEYLIFFGIYKETAFFGPKLKNRMKVKWEEKDNVVFENEYIGHVSELLLDLLLIPNKSFCKMLMDKYLLDVIAGFLSIHMTFMNESEQMANSLKLRIENILFERVPTSTAFFTLNRLLSIAEPKSIVSKFIVDTLAKMSMKKELLDIIISFYFPLNNMDDNVEYLDKKIGMVSKLILSVPSLCTDPKEYYKHITNQLIQAFRTIQTSHPVIQSVLSYTAFQLLRISKSSFISNFLHIILKPFYFFHTSTRTEDVCERDLDGNPIIAGEDEILCCMATLNALLEVKDPNHELIPLFTPVIPCLYNMFQFASQHAMIERDLSLDILSKYLNSTSSLDMQIAFDGILGFDLVTRQFKLGPSRKMMMVDVWKNNSLLLDCLIQLFDRVSDSSITGRFFLQLLSTYFSLSKIENGEVTGDSRSTPLLLLQIVVGFMEKYQQDIINEPNLILSFTRTILKQNQHLFFNDVENVYETQAREGEEEYNINTHEEFLFILLSLIKSTCQKANFNLDSSSLVILEDIIDEFTKCKNSEKTTPFLKDMIDDILIFAKNKLTLSQLNFSNSSGSSKKQQDSSHISLSKREVAHAIRDLEDDEAAMKAYGINRIKNMVLNKDHVFDEDGILKDILIRVLDQLDNEDSFVYLHAIKALSAMTDCYPAQTLPIIANRYTKLNQSVDYRLRIGETLLQSIQKSGDVFSKYAAEMIPPILKCLHDENVHLKSSAVSLISMVIETDPYSVLPFIHQLSDYIHHLLIFEEEVEVRRGLVFLLVQLLRQFGDTTKYASLPRQVWDTLSRDLEYIASMDKDVLTKGHAERGLEDLNYLIGRLAMER